MSEAVLGSWWPITAVDLLTAESAEKAEMFKPARIKRLGKIRELSYWVNRYGVDCVKLAWLRHSRGSGNLDSGYPPAADSGMTS
jgi:hypothetical protein